jgi:hypothetical protein
VDDLSALARLLEALRPWLGHLVIVGGWGHRLHRFHERAHPPPYAALRTRDADVAFSPTAPLEGDIAAALKSNGFREVSSLEHTPPVTQYHLGDEKAGFYTEFLVPLRGSEVKRGGRSDITMARAGITAQRLRHLDLLIVRPWTVALSEAVGVPLHSPVEVMVPNPVGFIAQKILIRKKRSREKQAQDALYIHDTLELFGSELPMLRVLWREQVRKALPGRTARSVERLCRAQFGVVDDVIRNAVRLPQDRTLRAERFQAATMHGLDAVFGELDEPSGSAP